MKTFKQILAIIGIILYVNYIISSPICVEEYTNRGTSICSEQHMHRQPTVKRNVTKQMQHIPMLVFYFAPKRNDFTFVITNNFYAIVNIPVWVAERYYPKHNETDIPITERIFSADFPISLQSSQGIFEIVLFDIPANIKLSKDFITLKIITNKKNKIYTLQVPKESKDLLSI